MSEVYSESDEERQSKVYCSEEDEDEGTMEDEENEETNITIPGEGLPAELTIEKQLQYRPRFTKRTTDMTTLCGWLSKWTTDMAVRELLQNMIDYLQKLSSVYPITFEQKDTEKLENPPPKSGLEKLWKTAAASQRKVYDCVMRTNNQDEVLTLGHVYTGPGLFILHQANSTLFPGHLFQQSSKANDLSSAGVNGCGMKEAALCLISKGAIFKMWMPADGVDEEYPADSWAFRLDKTDRMVVYSTKNKTYKARDLWMSATNISPEWLFKPQHYLAFQADLKEIEAPIKKHRDMRVKRYRILLNSQNIGICFNYGIFVQGNSILAQLGIGFDAEYKLQDRYRKDMGPLLHARIAVAIKSAAFSQPETIIPMLTAATVTLSRLNFGSNQPEDLYPNIKNSKLLLKYAVHKWKGIPVEHVVLAGTKWTDEEKNVVTTVYNYFCIDVNDDNVTSMKFDAVTKKYLATLNLDNVVCGNPKLESFLQDLEKRTEFTSKVWQDAPDICPNVIILETTSRVVVKPSLLIKDNNEVYWDICLALLNTERFRKNPEIITKAMKVLFAHSKKETSSPKKETSIPAATPQGTPQSPKKKPRLSAAYEIVQESLAKLKNEIDRTD